MAAVASTSPSMAFSSAPRPPSASQMRPQSQFFGATISAATARTKPLVHSASVTRKSSSIRMVSKLPNGRYIREDYLVKKVSANEVKEMLKSERSVPLIVDFYATWCGPCILMAQELETLAVEYGENALFVKVDTDDEYDFSRDMQVRGLPSLYFISPDPNKDAIRTEGLVPPEMIKNIIDNEM